MISADQAIEKLKSGQIVALPTETVYGLAGLIDNELALESIFRTKGRPLFDPLIVHVLDVDQAKSVCQGFAELHNSLAEKFWPGPLTLIGQKSQNVSQLVTAGHATVAVRSPAHPVFRQVLKGVGTPLAAPSANYFKKTSPTTAEHVIQEFNNQVDVVDGGECDIGLESTIVEPRWTHQKSGMEVILYRPGGIAASSIQSHLQERFKKPCLIRYPEGSTEEVMPGQMKDHYQPNLPLVLILDAELNWSDLLGKNFGIHHPAMLKLPDSIPLAARKLYSKLRDSATKQGADGLVLLKPSWWDEALAEALRDRLLKASSHVLTK